MRFVLVRLSAESPTNEVRAGFPRLLGYQRVAIEQLEPHPRWMRGRFLETQLGAGIDERLDLHAVKFGVVRSRYHVSGGGDFELGTRRLTQRLVADAISFVGRSRIDELPFDEGQGLVGDHEPIAAHELVERSSHTSLSAKPIRAMFVRLAQRTLLGSIVHGDFELLQLARDPVARHASSKIRWAPAAVESFAAGKVKGIVVLLRKAQNLPFICCALLLWGSLTGCDSANPAIDGNVGGGGSATSKGGGGLGTGSSGAGGGVGGGSANGGKGGASSSDASADVMTTSGTSSDANTDITSGSGGAAGGAGRGGAAGGAGQAGGAADGGGDASALLDSGKSNGDGATSTYRPCPSDGVCNIMPFGDSITDGYNSDTPGGYRVELFRLAHAAGKKITFVGSGYNGPDSANGAAFPHQHEGHSGWTIAPAGGRSGIRPWVLTVMPQFKPHIVLLMIGTNDAIDNYDMTNAPARLGALIDSIYAQLPNVIILVAQPIPSRGDASKGDDAALSARIKVYDDAIPSIIKARADAGKHLALVDMYTPFNPNKASLLEDRMAPQCRRLRAARAALVCDLGIVLMKRGALGGSSPPPPLLTPYVVACDAAPRCGPSTIPSATGSGSDV